MSFLKIKDPAERERVVKEFLEIKKNIRANELAEKTGKIELREDLSELFKPVTKAQKTAAKEITEGLRPIKEGIEQLPRRMPQPTPFSFSIPKRFPTFPLPVYETREEAASKYEPKKGAIFDGDTEFGIYEKGGEFFIGDKSIESVENEKGENFIIIRKGDEQTKIYALTEGLFNLLTSKEYDPDLKDEDVAKYREILIVTNTMYDKNNPETKRLKPPPKGMSKEKWKLITSTWERLGVQKKLGKGVKKVVIPSDPNALLKRLDLLMASKAAGNTGLRNEIVSVCDELKRQGFFDNKNYKRIMTLL